MISKRKIILLCASAAVLTFCGLWGCIKGKHDDIPLDIKIDSSQLTLVGDAYALPTGRVGEAYIFKFESKGGTYPHIWSIEEGGSALPPGLYLSATGNMTGTPTAAGSYSFTVVLTDSDNEPRSVNENFMMTIIEADDVVITTSALTPGYVDMEYGPSLLSAAGGTTPYTWSLAGGGLPPGIILDSGAISGTPILDGTYDFTVQVTDSAQPIPSYATKDLSMVVYPATSLTITTTSLPDAVANEAYGQTLTASGGVAPYTWDLESGSSPLPNGLYLSGSGHLTGTPTAAGTYSFSVEVTDSDINPDSTTNSLTITVTAAAVLSITTDTALTTAQVGIAYTETMAASGGTSPYTWALEAGSASLPDGISLTGTGNLTGTPTTAGSYSFSIKVTDSNIDPRFATKSFTLTVSPAPVLTITTVTPLTTAQVGVAYTEAMQASGGTTPYTWSIETGSASLPDGISLTGTGNLTGTPTTAGSYSFSIKVTDSDVDPHSITMNFTITVSPTADISISTGSTLATAQVGVAYAETLDATGGETPYTWTIEAGTLPAGLQLSQGGHLTGTPTAAGSYSFSIKVTDSDVSPHFATQEFLIVVSETEELSITTDSVLPAGTAGTAYSAVPQLEATGGKTPYTWSVEIGSAPLPDGMALSGGGHLTGIPTMAGSYSFSIKVTDSDASSHYATKLFTLTINP